MSETTMGVWEVRAAAGEVARERNAVVRAAAVVVAEVEAIYERGHEELSAFLGNPVGGRRRLLEIEAKLDRVRARLVDAEVVLDDAIEDVVDEMLAEGWRP